MRNVLRVVAGGEPRGGVGLAGDGGAAVGLDRIALPEDRRGMPL